MRALRCSKLACNHSPRLSQRDVLPFHRATKRCLYGVSNVLAPSELHWHQINEFIATWGWTLVNRSVTFLINKMSSRNVRGLDQGDVRINLQEASDVDSSTDHSLLLDKSEDHSKCQSSSLDNEDPVGSRPARSPSDQLMDVVRCLQTKDCDDDIDFISQRRVIVHVTFLKIGEISTLKECFEADILLRSKWREPELDKVTVSWVFLHYHIVWSFVKMEITFSLLCGNGAILKQNDILLIYSLYAYLMLVLKVILGNDMVGWKETEYWALANCFNGYWCLTGLLLRAMRNYKCNSGFSHMSTHCCCDWNSEYDILLFFGHLPFFTFRWDHKDVQQINHMSQYEAFD